MEGNTLTFASIRLTDRLLTAKFRVAATAVQAATKMHILAQSAAAKRKIKSKFRSAVHKVVVRERHSKTYKSNLKSGDMKAKFKAAVNAVRDANRTGVCII